MATPSLADVQAALAARGVRDVKLTLSPDAHLLSRDIVKAQVATVLTGYLRGAFVPLGRIGDTPVL